MPMLRRLNPSFHRGVRLHGLIMWSSRELSAIPFEIPVSILLVKPYALGEGV